MVMGTLQAEILPPIWDFDHPMTWIVTLAAGLALGAAIGAMQGSIISYLGVPAFIVTLGGFMIWRGAAWWVTQGRTVAPLDGRFQLMGGGIDGSIGATWSWVLAAIAVLLVVAAALAGRRRRQRFGFPVKPLWAEFVVSGLAIVAIVGFVATMNAYPHPDRRVASDFIETVSAERAAGGLQAETAALVASMPAELKALIDDPQAIRRDLIRGLESWGGLPRPAHGIAIPVLIVAVVVLLMHLLATRTRLGRYIFAIGGNPEAAQLAGINTKKVLLTVFVTMGMLCAVAAAIASARLQSAGNNLGTLDELRVIAAAVIGGTALAGGMGTIAGAVLGALIMQSLQSGMAQADVDSSLQQMVVGAVLVLAVLIDIVYQKRRK
jgi:D-xylose transport system permease protein